MIIDAVLAEKRNLATSDERIVLALEMIADQLRLVAQSLTAPDRVAVGAASSSADTLDRDRRAGDRWENEGGHLHRDESEAPEIARTLVEHFAVGGYHYTNLQHAIAEAKRTRHAKQDSEAVSRAAHSI